jgi:hypothetical protein
MRRLDSSSVLGLARSGYLALGGAGLAFAAAEASPSTIGRYSLASAYAGIMIAILLLGIDRTLLVSVPGLSFFHGPIVRRWVQLRGLTLAVCTLAVLITALLGVGAYVLPVAALVASRLLATDIESLLIREHSGAIAISYLVNGLATGAGLPLVAHLGAISMLWTSVAGNIIALAVLLSRVLTVSKEGVAQATPAFSMRSGLAFTWMAGAATVYQRADLAILGLLSVSLAKVGSYALALRGFDALVAFRGALVQRGAAALAHDTNGDKSNLVEEFRLLARRVSAQAVASGVLIILFSQVLRQISAFKPYPDLSDIVGIEGALVPLIASHTVTSTWIYSRKGSASGVWISVGLASSSVLLTLPAILLFGITGALVVTVGLEFLSYLAFGNRMRTEIPYPTLRAVALWPLLSAVLLVFFFAVRSLT